MKKIPAIIIFIILPLIAGYITAVAHSQKAPAPANLEFTTNTIPTTDRITLTEKGAIISLTNTSVTKIPTSNPALIEAVPLDNNYIGVDKQINYANLYEFSVSGSLVKTLQDGNTKNIDTMDWFTDPAVNANQNEIAFVSDKDKDRTNILDNALYIENLENGSSEKISDPDPHSGGIAHPVWNPVGPNKLIFDYYQYDENYNPYSIIDEYDLQTQTTNPLTTQDQNAYQGSFSPDGKQFIFLERDNDITTRMYIADITGHELSHIQNIASGDFAYPAF